ncbi:hypothetical protein CDAR_26281 [Caerostris darwini]|uniref:Ycf15 n=1 Tax=Caerostris darwini TaxID=1538125 RepID=A0AAV4N8C0_9ARAC|nr:hypothetical protein CDAR_26281 [Caerostris darwini]
MFSFTFASPNPDINRSPALTHPRFILLGDRLLPPSIYLYGGGYGIVTRERFGPLSLSTNLPHGFWTLTRRRGGHPTPRSIFILFHPFSEGTRL